MGRRVCIGAGWGGAVFGRLSYARKRGRFGPHPLDLSSTTDKFDFDLDIAGSAFVAGVTGTSILAASPGAFQAGLPSVIKGLVPR